jgi:hypothetical protein
VYYIFITTRSPRATLKTEWKVLNAGFSSHQATWDAEDAVSESDTIPCPLLAGQKEQ